MRSTGGFVAFLLVFVPPGLALLYALGFLTRLRQVPAALGPALLAGIATVTTVLIALLVLGMGVRLPQFLAVAVALTVALAAIGLVRARREGREEPQAAGESETPLERWLARGLMAALAAFFTIGISAFTKLPTVGDDWMIWSHKALALWHFDGELIPELFAGEEQGPRHLHYPLVQPLLQSLFFRSVGEIQLQEFHAVLWIIFGAAVWTLAWLVRTRTAALLAVIVPVAALGVMTNAYKLVAIGYADVTVASFIAVGVVAFGLWLDEGRARYALLGAVFLAGGSGVKNEGVVAAGVALAVAGAVMVVAHRRGALGRVRALPAWLGSAAIVAFGVLPWALWRSSKKILPQDVAEPSLLLDADYLSDRLDRFAPSFSASIDALANQGYWRWLVPCALVLTVACIARDMLRRQAAFYLAVIVLMFFALVFTYTTGKSDLVWWLETSADRTVVGIVFASGAALTHLIGLLVGGWGREPGPRPPAAARTPEAAPLDYGESAGAPSPLTAPPS